MTAVRGQLTIKSDILGVSVVAWMGSDPPNVTGGYAIWDIVDRPRRVSLTQWTGREPFQMSIPLVLDGFTDDRDIERDITNLEHMALPRGSKQPPTIEILGSAMPHAGLTWVITNIQWGDAIRNVNGKRLRQEVVLEIVSYIPIDKVKLSAAAQFRDGKL